MEDLGPNMGDPAGEFVVDLMSFKDAHFPGKLSMNPRTDCLDCEGNDAPAYFVMTSTTFLNVSTMSFLMPDNTDRLLVLLLLLLTVNEEDDFVVAMETR